VAEGDLDWALLIVLDDAYFVLFTPFHSFPFAFFLVFVVEAVMPLVALLNVEC